MARVVFTENLRRHVDVESCDAPGKTVGEVLDLVFSQHPRLRSYLLDDRGAVRKHIALILDGESIRDRDQLTDSLSEDSEIFVMQALSGG